MESIRVGVIGVGHLGMHHARVYTEILGAQLVGVVDINDERAHTIAEPLGVSAYNDFEMFLEETRPDAVSIVVPTSMHYEIAKTAMEHGVHVLVEKPVTTSVDEAEKLLHLAVEKDVILQVGHIERFNSAVEHAREFIKDPYFIQTRRIGPFSPRISDVGVVLDLMIHVSRVSEKRLRQMEITEAERFVTVNYETQDITVQRCVRQSGGNIVEVMEHPVFPKTEPLKMELQHFISCIREGLQPRVGIKDGKRALEVCVAALRQIHEEKTQNYSLLSAI